jgi:peptide/nickel transport system substrate-binding protein
VNSRTLALFAAVAGASLVLAQLVVPAWSGFHTWQYAGTLGLFALVIVTYVSGARSGADQETGRRLSLAMIGALVLIAAGLASGLLGPDTETIARAPGTVAPLPEAQAAAFFPNVDAAAIASGDARLELRKRDGSRLELPARGIRFAGTLALEAQPRFAAYIEARDSLGRHLTITQPTNSAFLSPVLTFPGTVKIAGKDLPSDAFALPSLHRQVRAFYFTKEAMAAMPAAHGTNGREALLFAVDDDTGRPVPGGIGFAPSGQEVTIAGVRLKATIGTYPQLVLSAVPATLALWLGGLTFVGGLMYAFVPLARPPRSLAPAALLLLALSLNACTRVGAGSASGLHAWTTPDTVRIGMYEEPDSLNPVVSSMSFSSDAVQLIFSGLIRYDAAGRPVPDLAREIPTLANGGISRDGRTLTYHLMPNARWQDGVPLTADDVIFTWHAIMNPRNNAPTRNGYDRIVSMDAPDPHTVRVHLNGIYPPALYLFRCLNEGAIVPKHLLSAYADMNHVAFNAKPIGSGPYILKSWMHGGEMHFDANPAYFRGVPPIKHVVLKFIRDQNTLLAELRAHEIDVDYGVPAVQVSQIRGLPGLRLQQTSTLHWEHFAFNTRRPPLDDARVRRALCFGLDQEALFQKVYHGLGSRGPVHFNRDFEWADRSIVPYPYDPRKAAALLDQAGWKLGAGGVRYRNGQPLTFTISTVAGVKNREEIEVLAQSWWHAIGVDASVKNYPASTLFAPAGAGGMLYGGKTDVSLFSWDNETPDPDDETYIAPANVPPTGQNVSFFQNAEVGRLVRAGLSTYNTAERRKAYIAIQHILYDQVPEDVLDWTPEIVASNDDLVGIRPVPVGSDLWNIGTWTFGRGPSRLGSPPP